MLRFSHLFLFIGACLASYGVAPDWCNEQWRASNYPRDVYYVGYASYIKQSAETSNEAISKSEEGAFHQLAQQITVKVNSTSTSKISAIETNGGYDEKDVFEQVSSVTSQAKVSNVKIEAYYDVNTLTAHTLVYIARKDLVDTYHSELDYVTAKIDGCYESSMAMIQRNEKSVAKSECDSILSYLPKMEDCIKMLVIIDSSFAQEEALSKYSGCRLAAQELKSQLEQSIQLYLIIEGTLPEKYKNLLYGELLGKITGDKCSVCANKEEADYIITLNPSLRQSSSYDDVQFVYFDVDVEFFNNYKKAVTYTNSYSAKGGAPSVDKANRKAIIKSSELIAGDLTKRIK